MLSFADQAPGLRPYNLEQPLWVFVGSSVNAVYSENREKRSDVLTVARFLHHFLEDKNDSGIVIEEDVISQSLFDGINRPGSGINILIGAKKFMEGWNSWRVSNMGLLNIGRREGSEIIQLFGRGVRLRGKAHSLKRSSALDGEHPSHIRLLETLNIFAVRANYMAQFREYLEREGIETEGHIELPLAIKANRDFLKKGLVLPRIPEDRNFARECSLLLERDRAAKVTVDLSLKIQSIQSAAVGVTTEALTSGQETFIPEESLNFVDWQQVYLKLLDYKVEKGYYRHLYQPLLIEHNKKDAGLFLQVQSMKE